LPFFAYNAIKFRDWTEKGLKTFWENFMKPNQTARYYYFYYFFWNKSKEVIRVANN